MNTPVQTPTPNQADRVRSVAVLVAVLWVVVIAAFFLWEWHSQEQNALELATTEARSSYNKDLLYRRWASTHGGVYVPITEKTPPNPYLEIPNRDVTTTSGQNLTLVNPAYMTRQVHEMSREQYGVRGHITSLKPLHPANAPDAWEETALRSFEAGAKERCSVAAIDGQDYLRLMQPMLVEASCLKCHSKQGYREGQIRGGISVAVPMDRYQGIVRSGVFKAALGHTLLGGFGLVGIYWVRQRLGTSIAHQRSVHEATRASEARYKGLFEHSLNAVALHEIVTNEAGKPVDYRFLEVNAAFEAHTGISAEQATGKLVTEVIPGIQETPFVEIYGEVALTGKPVRFEQFLPVLDRYYEIEAFSPQPRQFATVFNDVTERKRAETNLRRSEEKFRQLAENVQEVFWLGTPDWQNILYINPVYEKIWGRPCEGLYRNAREWVESVLEEDRPGVLEAIQRFGSGDWSNPAFPVYRIARPDGLIRWVFARVYPVRDDHGKVVRVAGIAEDITSAREATETLRQSEEKFSKVFENAPVMITLSDLETGVYLDINQAFCKVSGFTREEAIGRTSVQLGWLTPEARASLVNAVREHGRVQNLEVTLHAKDGRQLDCLYGGETVSIGGLQGLLSIGVDITERKRLAEQLRQAQKMEAIGQLAGGVAHDFNNILAATMMNLSLLERRPGFDHEVKEMLNELQTETKRAANLTRQLLMFSRRSVLEIRTLDLNDIVSNLLKMLGRLIGEHIKLVFEAGSCLPPVAVDAGMMEQVLMNLAVNARDAMPKGGRLTITTEAVTIDTAESTIQVDRRPGRFVTLSVSDTGCGMDETTLKRIFEPFFTTKEAGKGTGLGLATVYGITAQHKGWIEVTSQLGLGTVFRVYLPATTPDIQKPAEPTTPLLAHGTETILLVEDEITLRRSTAKGLRSLGYQVLEAQHGREAIDLWQKHRTEIRLLISDMVMPEGMNGLELAETLLQEQPKLKVILSSGYSAEMVDRGSSSAAGIHYLPKPFGPEILAKLIRECLDQG